MPIGMPSRIVVWGERSSSVPAISARLVLVTDATVAMVRTVRSRSTCSLPSDSEMAATTVEPETMPAVMLATNAATHTSGPTVSKCGTRPRKTSRQTTATRASTATLKTSLSGDSLRCTPNARTAPMTWPSRISHEGLNISASTMATSFSENEWLSRRKCRCTSVISER